jgi:linoleoyl-CoA desaturase
MMMTNNKIKFSPQNKSEFVKELREKVKDYFEKNNISKYGNANIVVKSALMISIYFVAYLLMVSGIVYSLPGILACWIFMGVGAAGIGLVLMHDANHGTFSKRPGLNKWLSKSLYFLGGYPPTWRYQHNTLHHGFTNIDGQDEDINPMGLLRFSPHQPLHKIHRLQQYYAWFFYGLMTFSWVTMKDFKQLLSYKKRNAPLSSTKNYNQLMMDLILSKAIYYLVVLVIPLIVLPIAWYWTVVFFFVMLFVSGLILSTIFQTAHVMPTLEFPLPDENGNVENNWVVHQLLTTTDYAPKSRIFSWLVGGLNYQVEHHLFPNISHIHYRKISEIVKYTTQKYNQPYYVQVNFFQAIRSHFRMLKILGQQRISNPYQKTNLLNEISGVTLSR